MIILPIYDAETGKRVEARITDTLAEIKAIPAPFVTKYIEDVHSKNPLKKRRYCHIKCT